MGLPECWEHPKEIHMPLMYMSPERLAVFVIFNQSKNITNPKKEKQNRTGEKLHSFSLGVEQEMLLLSTCILPLLQLRCKNKRERKERETFMWSHYWAGLVPEHHSSGSSACPQAVNFPHSYFNTFCSLSRLPSFLCSRSRI